MLLFPESSIITFSFLFGDIMPNLLFFNSWDSVLDLIRDTKLLAKKCMNCLKISFVMNFFIRCERQCYEIVYAIVVKSRKLNIDVSTKLLVNREI